MGLTTTINLIGVFLLFLELLGRPTYRGFFCNDESINYPFYSGTISESAVLIIALIIPFVVILGTEIWSYGLSPRSHVKICKKILPKWLYRLIKYYSGFIAGIAMHQLISSVGKFTIGRLRPHFLAVCKPSVTCNVTTPPTTYMLDFVCTGSEADEMEARQSFPSGHASLSFYLAIYLIFYLGNSRKWHKYGYLRIILQFLMVIGAWWISLTRVMDYWHHPTDVMGGALLGGLAGYLTAEYVCKFKYSVVVEQILPLKRPKSTGSINKPDEN